MQPTITNPKQPRLMKRGCLYITKDLQMPAAKIMAKAATAPMTAREWTADRPGVDARLPTAALPF